MTFRTSLWGRIGVTALAGARAQFAKVPPLTRTEPVGLVPLEKAWGIGGTNVLIANDLPSSILPWPERIKQTILHYVMLMLPNNEKRTRWDKTTASSELTKFMGVEVHPDLWSDWDSDEAWARAVVQGPCGTDLKREGDVWVVDCSVLGLAKMREGIAPLGVKIALHIDEQGPRPAWIQRQDGVIVKPDEGERWRVNRLIAGAALHTWVSMVRHVLNLHYIAGQSLSVLVHNHLPFEHPLHRMLRPHVEWTLAVNWGATKNFVGPDQLGCYNYAVSWEGWQVLIPAGWGAFTWEDYDIPDNFKRRGTDELIERGLYPYGEDATLIWGVLRAYCDDYIAAYYPDDAAVAGDKVLQDAFQKLDAVVPKPLRATTRDQLAHVLTRYISMVSLEHKIVSGVAWDYFTHPYWFPATASDADTVEAAAPYREQAESNVMFRYAISAVSWRFLDDWSHYALDEKGRKAFERLQANLRKAGVEIDARNSRRKWPFLHLHPEGLETSVAV